GGGAVNTPARGGGASPGVPVLGQETPRGGRGSEPPPGEPGQTDPDDVVAGTRDGYEGKAFGFEYSVGYQASATDLTLELQARRLEEEGGGAAESHEMHRDERIEYFEYLKKEREAEKQADESY